MSSLPRVITVDPTGIIAQQVRAAFELMDYLVVQIDVPGPNEALEELERGGIDTIISAWNPGNGMQGWELAAKLKQINENVKIMLLGERDDTELDAEMLDQSPFVYLKRPFDVPQLIRVLKAAVNPDGDIFAARDAADSSGGGGGGASKVDMGPVPHCDADRADPVMQALLRDLNPIAAMLATREGEIVVGRTTMGDIDYEHMSRLFGDSAILTIGMRDITGGSTQVFQMYDGDDYDVFMLSVGLHHSLIIVFDGADGAKQLGAVSRFGRRHAEDLVAVVGPAAFLIQRSAPTVEEPQVRRKSEQARKIATEELVVPELAKAELGSGGAAEEDEEPAEMESSLPQLEAIADSDFDADALFGDDFDEAAADDMFSLDALEDMATDEGKKGTLDWDKAKELGILDD